MKKLLYLALVRMPTEKAHGVQIVKTCEALSEAGVSVELAVPGRKTHIEGDLFSYYDVRKNFSLVTLGTPDLVFLGSVGFLISALWFSERARWQKSFWEADVIYSRDALVLLQYAFLGRTLVYEAHTKPTLISTFVAKRAHRVVVISEGLRDAYLRAGVRPDRIVVAHDGIDPKPFQKSYDAGAMRLELGIPVDKVIALYVGRIDVQKGAATVAQASQFLPDTHQVVLIGSGPLWELLQREYPKALVLPEIPYRRLPEVLATADILVAPNSAGDVDASRYTSPLKAFAYLAAKKPIIASDVPALRAIFFDAVQYVRPDDPEDLAREIQNPKTLLHIPDTTPYTWDDRASTIIDALLTAPVF